MNCQITRELCVHLIAVASFLKTMPQCTSWMALTRLDIQTVHLLRYASKYSHQHNIVKNLAKKVGTRYLLVSFGSVLSRDMFKKWSLPSVGNSKTYQEEVKYITRYRLLRQFFTGPVRTCPVCPPCTRDNVVNQSVALLGIANKEKLYLIVDFRARYELQEEKKA